MNTQRRYSPEFRERAVRLVDEQIKEGKSQCAAMQSISQKLGCDVTPEMSSKMI
jgi:transposase-like protein